MKPGLRHVPPAQLAEPTGVSIYFSDPHSRGSAACARTTMACCASPSTMRRLGATSQGLGTAPRLRRRKGALQTLCRNPPASPDAEAPRAWIRPTMVHAGIAWIWRFLAFPGVALMVMLLFPGE